MIWKLVNSSSDGFLFSNLDLHQQSVEVLYTGSPTLLFLLLISCNLQAEWQKTLFSFIRGEGSSGMEFLLGFLQMQPNRRVCCGESEWRRVSFHLRCCTVALVLLSYLCETPTNFIYIFIRCRQGWHICVRRPHVHR